MEKNTVKFPFQFDVAKLKSCLQAYTQEDWLLHYNTRDYDGDWRIIALKSVAGDKYKIFSPFEIQEPTQYTEHMNKAPYFKEVLDTLQCEKTTVRLMRLKPGARIKEHSDYNLSVNDTELRLHIPISTNPQMEFYLNKERIYLGEGECWYLNFNLLHSLYNGGATPRVHLVVDCVVNDWLKSFF